MNHKYHYSEYYTYPAYSMVMAQTHNFPNVQNGIYETKKQHMYGFKVSNHDRPAILWPQYSGTRTYAVY